MIDRRTVSVPRSWVVSVVWGMCLVGGILVMVGMAMLRQNSDVADLVQAQRRADMRAEADRREATKQSRERVQQALGEIREILSSHINAHTEEARVDHDKQLEQLTELLRRKP